MNERQLKVFFEVATRLNMTLAASSLYMSQSAVSQTIKDIEREQNAKLFDRIGKRLFLTQSGDIFLKYARRILNLYEECSKSIENINNTKIGTLKLGASTTIGTFFLTEIIGEYSKINSDIEISIAIDNTQAIANLIHENKIDFAFVEGPINSPEIVVKEFCDDELIIIASPEHELAKKSIVNIQDLENQKFLMREKGSGTRDVLEKTLIKSGIELKNVMELGNTIAIKRIVETGFGISCLSKIAVKNEVSQNKIAQIKLDGLNICRKFNIIYHKDKFISNLHNSFIDYCKSYL